MIRTESHTQCDTRENREHEEVSVQEEGAKEEEEDSPWS